MYSSFSTWTGHICSVPSWWCGGGGGEGEEGGGGEGEIVHLLTHAPLGGRMGKNMTEKQNKMELLSLMLGYSMPGVTKYLST